MGINPESGAKAGKQAALGYRVFSSVSPIDSYAAIIGKNTDKDKVALFFFEAREISSLL